MKKFKNSYIFPHANFLEVVERTIPTCPSTIVLTVLEGFLSWLRAVANQPCLQNTLRAFTETHHALLKNWQYNNEIQCLCSRHHSGQISSTLDSFTFFTNSKAFLQTCLKSDVIYTRDCFICLQKCKNYCTNHRRYALHFPFIKS